jgi:hypothetical protein
MLVGPESLARTLVMVVPILPNELFVTYDFEKKITP